MAVELMNWQTSEYIENDSVCVLLETVVFSILNTEMPELMIQVMLVRQILRGRIDL